VVDREVHRVKWILGLLATAAGLWVATAIIPEFDFDGSLGEFLLVALLLGVANAFVKPILKVLSFPVILVTLGLFLLVINAAVLQLVVWLASPDRLDLGLTSGNFGWTILAALVVSIVRAALEAFFKDD
jgi:putative membrane protein